MNLDLNADGEEYKKRLPEFCGAKEFPVVFVAGEIIGNLKDTRALLAAQKDMKAYIKGKLDDPSPK